MFPVLIHNYTEEEFVKHGSDPKFWSPPELNVLARLVPDRIAALSEKLGNRTYEFICNFNKLNESDKAKIISYISSTPIEFSSYPNSYKDHELLAKTIYFTRSRPAIRVNIRYYADILVLPIVQSMLGDLYVPQLCAIQENKAENIIDYLPLELKAKITYPGIFSSDTERAIDDISNYIQITRFDAILNRSLYQRKLHIRRTGLYQKLRDKWINFCRLNPDIIKFSSYALDPVLGYFIEETFNKAYEDDLNSSDDDDAYFFR